MLYYLVLMQHSLVVKVGFKFQLLLLLLLLTAAVHLSGRIQGTLDQLRAHGPHLGCPGFLHGLFYQGKTLGLTWRKPDSNPQHHGKTGNVPQRQLKQHFRTFFDNIDRRRLQPHFVLSRNYFLAKVLSNLLLSSTQRFSFKFCENLIFLFGLHIRIFHSLAFSIVPF